MATHTAELADRLNDLAGRLAGLYRFEAATYVKGELEQVVAELRSVDAETQARRARAERAAETKGGP